MAFGMSPFPFQFGSRGGGGDPTVLTDAILAALGFTYTRTGEVYGRRAPGGPGNYVRHATNDPEFDFTEVDGKNYPSLIMRGAATPLVSYSADLTNAAWTKTNCTAALALGGLEHNADWEGPELASSFSPPYNMSDGDLTVIFGQTFPTATAFIVTIDLTYGGVNSVKATFFNGVVASWNASNSIVASTSYFLRTDGAADRFILQNIGPATNTIINSLSIKQVDAHSLVTATADNATVTRQLTRASANRNTRWKIKAPETNVGDVKVSQDNGNTSITLTPGEFADIELGEQTSANPTIWLQLTDNGDTVEHYDVQMAELTAGTPVPNFVPQGATPAAVGVASVARTSVDLADAYDVDALVVFRGVANSYVMQHADTLSDFFEIYMTSAQRAAVRVREGGGTFYSAVSPSSTFADGEVVKISGTYSGGGIDLLKDGASVATATGATDPDGVGVVYLGHAYGATGFANTHIIAIRDNEGTILGEAGKGFNLGALERYEASL